MTFILNSNETIHEAIKILAKANNNEDNPEVSVSGGDVDTIEWHGDTTVIAKADIQAKMLELQTAYTNNAYGRTRAIQYKQLKEQLDLLYKDMTAGKLDNTGEWHKHIKKVKDDNPKS